MATIAEDLKRYTEAIQATGLDWYLDDDGYYCVETSAEWIDEPVEGEELPVDDIFEDVKNAVATLEKTTGFTFTYEWVNDTDVDETYNIRILRLRNNELAKAQYVENRPA